MNMNLIGAKVYYDGAHWIAIPHTERRFKPRKRHTAVEQTEQVKEFEKAFKEMPKGKKAKKKEKLLKEFTPLFKTETEATEFVEKQFERLNRNRIERYKRLKRKAYLQQWHYFCTATCFYGHFKYNAFCSYYIEIHISNKIKNISESK